MVSKNTHNEWLNRGFTRSEKVVDDDITNLILGDIADDPKSEEVVVEVKKMKTLVFLGVRV